VTATEQAHPHNPADPAASAAQDRYQVRFDVGLDGARRIGASAHLLIWCDALPTERVPVDALPHRLEVVDARLGAVAAIAERLIALQSQRAERTMVAVIAAGSPIESPEGFPVEDVLLAGAVIDALGERGIDATSPEAAAAAAAFHGLRGALGHMLTASTAGRALAASSGQDALSEARARLERDELVVLREFSPEA